ncbi:MAG: LLM class flavin-dependent oxidoreductase [Actinomycetota bacterium]
MKSLRFGSFLAPHHPIGEHPTLQFKRDLDHAEQLDQLGFDEFWCGEHHSTGWETIASPEMFLAAAGQRTKRIKLGTGVVSLPYHHPFLVAQRIVQLDHMTDGRAMFGTGPGALPSDAHAMGIDPMVQRDRQDEAIGVIQQLLAGGERVTHRSDWFELNDAALQILPVQDRMPMATASMISPSGMTLAGKYGIGVLSIGSMSTAGIQALPTQWSFAEEAAEEHGTVVDRKDWRIVIQFHVAETRKEAREQAKEGLLRWHNEYNVGTLQRPGAVAYDSPDHAVDEVGFSEGATGVIGTPEDLVDRIRDLYELSGGFGVVIGFAHDWANIENTRRSWDLVGRYVVPEVQGLINPLRRSQTHVIENRESFDRARDAVVTKIMSHERAAEAFKTPPTAVTPLGVASTPAGPGAGHKADVAEDPGDPAA